MRKYRFNFPSYIQHDQMDCGATCLKIIAKHFGKSFSIKFLRDRCYSTREGVSLYNIARAAEMIGLRTLAVKINFEDLKKRVPLPGIIHWNQNHFVVIYKVTNHTVHISDPAAGLVQLSHEEFCEGWQIDKGSGGVLLLETTPDFYSHQDVVPDHSFIHYLKYLKPYHKYLLHVIIGMIATLCIGMIMPFINKSIVDFGIMGANITFIHAMLIAGLVLAFSTLISSFIQNRLMLYVSERINLSMVSDFIRKTLRLPVSFFERKMISDLLTRISDHDRIQSFIMNTFLGVLLNFLLILIYGLVLFYYERNIFFVFLLANIIYTLWIFIFLNRRKKLDNLLFSTRSQNSNSLLEIFENINEIKINNLENRHRWKWEASRFKIYDLRVKNMNIDQIEVSGSSFIINLQTLFITYIAASNVINGSMTLGMMMATQYILGQLSSPINSMISYVHSLQFARISLKRINEILIEEKPEKSLASFASPSSKNIELKNVYFRYHPNLDYALNRVSVNIPEGKVTAIVGESGSGKTTLVKLLLRFYEPTEGNINIGDVALESLGLEYWRDKCGVVMQDGKLFDDTLLYNITLKDDEAEIDKVLLKNAILLANIECIVAERPQGLYTPIGMNGVGLSQGQKQRILIARAIYKNPDFIFLDEATNALDTINEKLISGNLDNLFKNKTALIIAHRLSTVKNAHNIVVLDKGRVVEQGTHLELVSRKGSYYNLISNQLELEYY